MPTDEISHHCRRQPPSPRDLHPLTGWWDRKRGQSGAAPAVRTPELHLPGLGDTGCEQPGMRKCLSSRRHRFASSTPAWACRHRRRTGCHTRRRRQRRAPQRADSAESFSYRIHVGSWPWVHGRFVGRSAGHAGSAPSAERTLLLRDVPATPDRANSSARGCRSLPPLTSPRGQVGGVQSGERPSVATIRSSTWVLARTLVVGYTRQGEGSRWVKTLV